MITFLHTFVPDRILAHIGSITIYWYGLCITLGVVAALWVCSRLMRYYGITFSSFLDVAFWVVICGLLADRAYYVIYAWSYYKDHLLDIVKIWEGGLAIYGGILGGAAAAIIYTRMKKMNTRVILDVGATGVATGLMIGRFGNYFNQELFGTPTSLPWGIPIAQSLRPAEYSSFSYFHPTFLYESMAMAVVIGLLLLIHRLVIRKKIPSGMVVSAFLVLYGLERFFIEFLRTDFSPFLLGLRANQVMSIVAIVAGISYGSFLLYRQRSKHLQSDGTAGRSASDAGNQEQ